VGGSADNDRVCNSFFVLLSAPPAGKSGSKDSKQTALLSAAKPIGPTHLNFAQIFQRKHHPILDPFLNSKLMQHKLRILNSKCQIKVKNMRTYGVYV